MPKVKISDYSTTNSSNTDINSINIDEGCAPSGINNAIREVMVHLRNWQTNASGDGATFANLVVQGTGSFTGAVTMSAGATLSGTNTLSGATVLAAQLGTSASPSIYFTSDTNTGIFSPTADTVAVATGGSERVRVDSSGNVGIGVTPATPLHVKGANNEILRLQSSDATTGSLYLSYVDSAGTEKGYVGYGSSLSNDFIISNALSGDTRFSTNGTERMRITSGGEVYIAGTTDQGAYNLQCNGTGVWGAGAYVNGSDARIKEDVAPIDSGLDVVEKLNPVTYRYKEDWSKDQSVQTGFIAQELLVALDGKNYVDGIVQQGGAEGYYSVAYQNIIPILTAAIQELKAITDAQATRIEALEAQNAAFEARLAALEAK